MAQKSLISVQKRHRSKEEEEEAQLIAEQVHGGGARGRWRAVKGGLAGDLCNYV